MYTLYYSPGACSLAIHALLCSLEAPFKTVCINIQKGDNRTPEYLKINPRGQVPVLTGNNLHMRESTVIAVYLAEQHKSPLLPTGSARWEMEQWLNFYNAGLHAAYSTYFLMSKNLKDVAREEACQLAAKRISFLWREVETHLEERKYLCGDQLTLADLFHAVIANWSTILAHKVELGPNIIRLGRDVAALPYFQQALAVEQITYKLGN